MVSQKRIGKVTHHPLAIAYVLSLVVCWLPVPLIGYVVPPLCLCVYTLVARDGLPIKRYVLLTSLAFAIALAWAATQDYFLFQNAVIAYITYNMWICLMCLVAARDFSVRDLQLVENSVFWMILVQALVGIAQAAYGSTQTGTFDSGNGDYVRGTLSLSLVPIAGFTNPTYGANLAFLLLAGLRYIMVSRRPVNKWRASVLALGTISLVLASVVHILGFLVVALLLAWLVMLPKKQILTNIAVLSGVGVLVLFIYNVLNQNVTGIPAFAQTFLEKTPRGQLIQRLFTAIPEEYPLMPWVGLGPGQFCSRAGLIAGGVFFGGPRDRTQQLPLLNPELSDPLNKYQLDLWYSSVGTAYDGSNYRPFSSWISFYSEFGLLGVVVLGVFIARIIARARRWGSTREGAAMAFVFASGVGLMFFLGFQENYWEVPQALFPGGLYLCILYRHASLTAKRPPRLHLQPVGRRMAEVRVRQLQPART